MGYQNKSICFNTYTEAQDNYWASYNPYISNNDPDDILYYVTYNQDWKICQLNLNLNTYVCNNVPTIQFPSCDQSGPAFDGLLLGSGVVTVWVIVWAIMSIKRAL